MQVIPRDVPGSFSDSFQTGLQQLVQAKMGQLQQRHQVNEYGKAYEALGLPKELIHLPNTAQAKLLEELSPLIASKLSSQMQGQGKQPTPMQQAIQTPQPSQPVQRPSIINAMQGLDRQAKPEVVQQPIIQRQRQQAAQPAADLIRQEAAPIAKIAKPSIAKEELLKEKPESQRVMTKSEELRQSRLAANNLKLQEKEQRVATKTERLEKLLQEKRQLAAEREQRILTRSEQAEKRRLEADLRREKLAQAKEARELAKDERIEQHRINKELGPIHKEITQAARGAKDDDRRLNRMEELINKGDLSRPRFHSLLNTIEHGIFGFGINLHSLESADSQEFDKLSKEFLKNAKNVFGSRITDNDVKVFLKMVPDLSQNREGKLAIIHNMKAYNEALQVRKKASDQVLAANKGKIPFDYEEQIDRIADPELDRLAKRFTSEERIKPQIKNPESQGILSGAISDTLNQWFGRS